MNVRKIEEIQEVIDKFGIDMPEVFLETGTFIGQTSFEMSKYFKKVLTVEIDDKLYNDVVNVAKKKNINNIDFFHGDSSILINEMINKIKDKPTLFFLDGHFSGNISWDATGEEARRNGSDTHHTWSTDWEFRDWPSDGQVSLNTGRGKKDVPLMEELRSIDENHNSIGLIIIDDSHLFGKKYTHGDWRDISEEKILNSFKNFKVVDSYMIHAHKEKRKDMQANRFMILIERK